MALPPAWMGAVAGSRASPGARAAHRHGRRMLPLPETRKEAEAIGDVVVLGAEATEAGFASAVAR